MDKKIQANAERVTNLFSLWKSVQVLKSSMCALVIVFSLSINAYANEATQQGYRSPDADESEFDNRRDSSAPPPLPEVASGEQEYQDTPFGDYLYSEASLATKLEMLRLLSKQTPPTQVFIHAISMGLGVDEMLRASASYDDSRAREMAVAAVNVLPLVDQSSQYQFSGYELKDIERDQAPKYLVADVVNRFFEDRDTLFPHPDWLEGQYHFDASVQELHQLIERSRSPKEDDAFHIELDENAAWYLGAKATSLDSRSVFISLYEGDKSIRIDNIGRIESAFASNPDGSVPVVFIFNKVNEGALDQLVAKDYPQTIRGVRDAYVEKSFMLTPVPEWDLGEYHIQASLKEIDELFNLPTKEDFEPDHWQRLLSAARQYSVKDTSFLIVVMPNANRDEPENDDQASLNILVPSWFALNTDTSLQLASWDNPRSESVFPFVAPGTRDGEEDQESNSQRSRSQGDDGLLGDGLILNRPDLIAALLYLRDELRIESVPIAFYYVDSSRVKSFLRGPRALLGIIEGIRTRPPGGGGNGGFGPPPENPPECASPPCSTSN